MYHIVTKKSYSNYISFWCICPSRSEKRNLRIMVPDYFNNWLNTCLKKTYLGKRLSHSMNYLPWKKYKIDFGLLFLKYIKNPHNTSQKKELSLLCVTLSYTIHFLSISPQTETSIQANFVRSVPRTSCYRFCPNFPCTSYNILNTVAKDLNTVMLQF